MASNDPAVLENYPAAKPPPGVVANYAHPSGDGPVLIIVGSILVFIMLVFVGARIFTKVKITRRSSPDDCAYICFLVRKVTDCLRYLYGCSGK